METRLGTLEFTNGVPTAETARRLYENGDFTRSVEAFLNGFQDTSIRMMRTGMLSIGVQDNEVLSFPELMDSASLLLTRAGSPTRGA